MRRIGFVGTLALVGAGLLVAASWTEGADAAGGKPKGGPKTAGVVVAEPPTAVEPIVLAPSGLAWGMSPDDVTALYDKVLDRDYVPLFKKVPNGGVREKELEASLADQKASFRRSLIEFGTIPTGVDHGPLFGEYRYRNGEALMSLSRAGTTRYFFFAAKKLYKVYDEVPLATGDLGKSYADVLTGLGRKLGINARVLGAAAAEGRRTTEADWVDASSHLRVLDRSAEGLAALVNEDRATAATLAEVSKKQAAEGGSTMDPGVQLVTRGADAGAADPNAHVADAFTGRSHAPRPAASSAPKGAGKKN